MSLTPQDILIPRRPEWTAEMSKEELDRGEKDAFLEWRRSLAEQEEEAGAVFTPFEKNIEFWRQLWRVIERSGTPFSTFQIKINEISFSSILEILEFRE